MPRLRIAFSGAGMVSDAHAAAIQNSNAAQLIGLFDPDPDVSRRRAAAWSCKSFDSFEAIVASRDVDAVFILSPPAFHVAQAALAMEAGKHVLVEKPVGKTVSEVAQLQEAQRRTGRVCLPGHTDVYVPEFRRVIDWTRSGRLGVPRLAAMFYAIAHTEAVAVRYEGALHTVLPHHAYTMHGMLGLPAAVSAGSTKPMWPALETPDQAWIALDYPPHTTALLFATMAADDESAESWSCVLKVIGSDGSASGSWRSGMTRSDGPGARVNFAPVADAFRDELEAFVSAVEGDGALIRSTLDDALGAQRIIEAAARSIETGRRVDLAASDA